MFYIIALISILIFASIFLLKRKTQKSNSYPLYRSDLFWNVVFEWNWERKTDGFHLDPSSIKKYCPNCHNDLSFRTEGGYYFLFCEQCKFISSEYFYSEDADEKYAEIHFYDELNKMARKNI